MVLWTKINFDNCIYLDFQIKQNINANIANYVYYGKTLSLLMFLKEKVINLKAFTTSTQQPPSNF